MIAVQLLREESLVHETGDDDPQLHEHVVRARVEVAKIIVDEIVVDAVEECRYGILGHQRQRTAHSQRELCSAAGLRTLGGKAALQDRLLSPLPQEVLKSQWLHPPWRPRRLLRRRQRPKRWSARQRA